MAPLGATTAMALALWLCLPSCAWGRESEEIEVSVSGSSVTLSCPVQTDSWWKQKGAQKLSLSCSSQSCKIADFQGARDNGLYGCSPEGTQLYLHVKECPDCVEVAAGFVMGVIAADLLVTLGVVVLAYHCSRKRAPRSGGGPTAGGPRARPRGQKEDRPPPVPNPDYEPIRRGQREVYAGLEPRAS